MQFVPQVLVKALEAAKFFGINDISNYDSIIPLLALPKQIPGKRFRNLNLQESTGQDSENCHLNRPSQRYFS